MKSVLFGAAALVLGVVIPAVAEDLAPLDPWAGAYIGVHGGLGSANRNGCGDLGIDVLTFALLPTPDPIDSCAGAPPDFEFDYDQTGYLKGVQGGYNWTPFEMFLVGLEVRASLANITGELDGLFGGVGTWNGLATATAKAGVTTDHLLVYVEGGLGVARSSFDGDLGCVFDVTHSGPVAGGGVSLRVSDRASIDLKYQHVWSNATQSACNSTATALDPAFVAIPTELRTQGSMDVVTVGINFQLGH